MKIQNFGDTFEKIKRPEDATGRILERMGVVSGQKPSDQQKRIEEMKAVDKAKSRQLAAKIVGELQLEIKRLQKIREEQLQQRRQKPEPKVTPAEPQPLQEPPLKKQRGILGGFWGRRAQRAREQAQPEMAGRRVGG